ncbi:repressor LexA [bacterium]|jgi:repressor LexA|nr:repressor LexA [bacterium]
MEALTKKQQAILDYMKGHVTQHSYWPSIRDIQAKFRFASTNAVFGHLQALERKGVLQRIPGAARAYKIAPEVVPDLSETVIRYEGPDDEALGLHEVKIQGSIAAGFPDYTESSGVVASMQAPLPPGARRRAPESFALRVRGDSMIDADIHDGDMVIIEPGIPKHGDIVAALIDQQTTLKRLIKQGGKVYLKAENKNYPNLEPTSELVIQGIAKQVVKQI